MGSAHATLLAGNGLYADMWRRQQEAARREQMAARLVDHEHGGQHDRSRREPPGHPKDPGAHEDREERQHEDQVARLGRRRAAELRRREREHGDGEYAEREDAGVPADAIGYINAHATSTPVGDIAEYVALKRVFGDHLKNICFSATKSSTGHLLGGAGAIEAIFTVLALHERTAPPTINLENQDPEIPLDVVTSPRKLPDGPILAISNSFGFGGHNAVIAFRSYN